MSDADEVGRVVRRAGREPTGASARLPSVSNRVFAVDTDGGRVVVRLATARRAGVDHEDEVRNASVAAARGLTPAIVWADPGTGELVTEFVDDIVVGPEGAASGPHLDSLGRCLAALHEGPAFSNRYDPLAVLDDLFERVASDPFATDAAEAMHDLAPVVDRLARGTDEVPCHNDTWPGNFLVGSRVLLVDWEYSGQNDAAWDLADLSVEADLDGSAEDRLVVAYSSRRSSPDLGGRVTMWKPICDVLWSVWSVAEHLDGNRSSDLRAEAQRRLARARRLTAAAVAAARR